MSNSNVGAIGRKYISDFALVLIMGAGGWGRGRTFVVQLITSQKLDVSLSAPKGKEEIMERKTKNHRHTLKILQSIIDNGTEDRTSWKLESSDLSAVWFPVATDELRYCFITV
jgi:hypothetical protein